MPRDSTRIPVRRRRSARGFERLAAAALRARARSCEGGPRTILTKAPVTVQSTKRTWEFPGGQFLPLGDFVQRGVDVR